MNFQYILLNEKKEIITSGTHKESQNLFPTLRQFYQPQYYIIRYTSFYKNADRYPVIQRRVNMGRIVSFDPVKKKKNSLVIHTISKGSEDYESLLSIFKTWRFINGHVI